MQPSLFFRSNKHSRDTGFAEGSFRAMRKLSRVLKVLFLVLTGLFGIACIALAVKLLSSLPFNDMANLQKPTNVIYEFLSVGGLGINAAIFAVAGLVFKDISAGEAPFNHKQANRIRIIAWLLLAYALLDSFIPTGIVIADSVNGVAYGANRNAVGAPSIRLGPVLFALVFFFLSSVFSYGVKLQELSDDTV